MSGGLFGGAYARAYTPTLRDRAAMAMMGSASPNSLWGQLVGGLVGSNGVGGIGRGPFGTNGLVDMTPLGLAFQADEGGRQMASGHPFAGALSVASALPLPVGKVAQAAKGLFGGARQAAEKAAAQAVEHQAAAQAAPIIAYHGSPHQFDKFDTAKIGTGEGAQVYGHGLYFAENEKTARAYRDALTRPSSPLNDTANAWLQQAGGDKHKAASIFRQFAKDAGLADADTAPVLDAIGGGHMYQVGINAHPDHFLDWDKPLSEQHPAVQDALGPTWMDNYGHLTGGQLNGHLKQVFGGDQAGTAAILSEKGIPGVKYLDQGSRTAGDGTRNYVVFNPDHIDILKRYGIPATVLGGAGAAAYGAQQQQPDGGA